MISIIVPVYNTNKYLNECLLSVQCLTTGDWECILIDDGSSDGSSETCDQWATKDSRFRVIHQHNSGVSIARNVGINMAKGDYLYFLDSDDWCEPGIFSYINGEDVILGEYNEHKHNVLLSENIPLDWLKGNVISCIGSFIVRKETLYNYNIRFKSGCRYGEDLAFTLRCLYYSKCISIVPNRFVYYRQVPTSAMRQYTLSRYDVFMAWDELVEEFSEDRRNLKVVEYLRNVSLPETMVKVTKELFRTGTNTSVVKNFLLENLHMRDVLLNSWKNMQTPQEYRNASLMFYLSADLYKSYVVVLYSWYSVRAFLGKIKSKCIWLK